MTQINFQELEIYTDISKTKRVKGDVREPFANILYTQANGIEMLVLAMKIYKSTGATEFNNHELDIILRMANNCCTPAFIEGLRLQTDKKEQEKEDKL